ncbi:hypothetical protein OESDEN_03703 [Oesophagostomum dentatum]|uniref:Uncharacterized protein n=1 Tax=Oesophagostomum dentatum TaxID=61180 RepID=A0A0B1TFK3_OESDE|nr:hypothetical protein OESDEN_03703 [Oesophagostomum dentatum]
MLFLLHLDYFGYINIFRRKIEMTRDFRLMWMEKRAEVAEKLRSLQDSTEEENADQGREHRQLLMFKEIEEWCAPANYSDETPLPLASELSLLHKREDVWDELRNRVTIFCGTFYPDLFLKKDGFPDITTPFVHINLTEEDIFKGYFIYICLVRARELLRGEVEGFFMMSDDATFNFWHTLKLRRVLHPTGITWQQYTGMWWPSPYGTEYVYDRLQRKCEIYCLLLGKAAVEHALMLITDKYRNDWSTQNMWKKYQDGVGNTEGKYREQGTAVLVPACS